MSAAHLAAPNVALPSATGDPRCAGKTRFASPSLAFAVNERRADAEKRGQVYRCDQCGGWHLGRVWVAARGRFRPSAYARPAHP